MYLRCTWNAWKSTFMCSLARKSRLCALYTRILSHIRGFESVLKCTWDVPENPRSCAPWHEIRPYVYQNVFQRNLRFWILRVELFYLEKFILRNVADNQTQWNKSLTAFQSCDWQFASLRNKQGACLNKSVRARSCFASDLGVIINQIVPISGGQNVQSAPRYPVSRKAGNQII